MDFVRLNLPRTYYTNKLISPLRNLFGAGFGNSTAPKKSKFSFGSPCAISCQRKIIWLFLVRKSITTVLGAILRKLLSISYEIACGLRRSSVNLRVSCPCLFFQLPLQIWLQTNTTSDTLILHHQLPWKMYFTFLCWHLWLARNERIFNNQSHSQSQIIHKAV